MNRNPDPHSRQGLAAQRQALLLRSTQLREQLTQHAQVFQPALRTADKMRQGAQWVRRNPAWMLLGAAALTGMAAVRPRAALRLVARAWSGWQLVRQLRPMVAGLLRRL